MFGAIAAAGPVGSRTGMSVCGVHISRDCAALKRRLGIRTPTRVTDPRFMIAEVDGELRRRFRLDVVPVDLSQIVHAVQPDSRWVPRTLFDGTEVLLPPGTGIREEADGAWTLLAGDGSPTSYRMPRGGYYFDDTAFNPAGRIDPDAFRPQSDVPDEHLRGGGLGPTAPHAFGRLAKNGVSGRDPNLVGRLSPLPRS